MEHLFVKGKKLTFSSMPTIRSFGILCQDLLNRA